MKNNKTILVFPMSSWWEWQQGRRNRNWFILQQLRNDSSIDRIIVVDPPAPSLRRMLKNMLMWGVYSKKYTQVVKKNTWGVWQIDKKVVLVSSVSHVKKVFIPQSILQKKVNEIWSWNPFVPIKKQAKEHVVFDAVDDWSNHPVYSKYSEVLSENYKKIMKTADTIFTVSEKLQEKFLENIDCYWIPNGVDVEAFSKGRDVKKSQTPQVVYTGVIQDRFDIDLVEYCAKEMPVVQFKIVGPVWKGIDVSALEKLSNVTLVGMVSHTTLPQLLGESWVGIIPHKKDAFTQSMNPMKAYEYLAAGLPVVSTHSEGISSLPFLVVATTNEQFLQLLKQTIEKYGDTSVAPDMAYDSWEERYKTMQERIKTKAPEPSSG
jgi:hypothetical protein